MRISDWSSDVCSSDLNLALPVTYKFIFDGAIANNDMSLLVDLLLLLVGLYIFNGAAGLIQDQTTARIGAGSAADLRERLFANVQAQEIGRATGRERVCQDV